MRQCLTLFKNQFHSNFNNNKNYVTHIGTFFCQGKNISKVVLQNETKTNPFDGRWNVSF